MLPGVEVRVLNPATSQAKSKSGQMRGNNNGNEDYHARQDWSSMVVAEIRVFKWRNMPHFCYVDSPPMSPLPSRYGHVMMPSQSAVPGRYFSGPSKLGSVNKNRASSHTMTTNNAKSTENLADFLSHQPANELAKVEPVLSVTPTVLLRIRRRCDLQSRLKQRRSRSFIGSPSPATPTPPPSSRGVATKSGVQPSESQNGGGLLSVVGVREGSGVALNLGPLPINNSNDQPQDDDNQAPTSENNKEKDADDRVEREKSHLSLNFGNKRAEMRSAAVKNTPRLSSSYANMQSRYKVLVNNKATPTSDIVSKINFDNLLPPLVSASKLLVDKRQWQHHHHLTTR